LGKASDKHIESVRNWVEGKKPLVPPESQFLDDENDLFPIAPKAHASGTLEHFVEEKLWKYFPLKVC
jgi:hypothetical protein